MFSIIARNYLHKLTPADWKNALTYATGRSRRYPDYRGKMEAGDLVHEAYKRLMMDKRTWNHRKTPLQNVFDIIWSIASHDYESNNPRPKPRSHSGQEDNRRVPRFVGHPDGWEDKIADSSKRDPALIAKADDLHSKLQKKLDSKDHRCRMVLALLVDNEGLTLDELAEKSDLTRPVVRRLVNIIRDEMKALHDEN